MNLPYLAADTLQMTLYNLKGKFVGQEVRQVRLGPWTVDLPISVTSDLITGQEMGLWVTMGDLPLYLVVKENHGWLLAMDPEVLKTCTHTATDMHARIKELKAAVRGMFHWREKSGRWTRVVVGETTIN